MHAEALHHDRLALRLPVLATSVGIGRRAAAQFAEETGCDDATLWRVRLSVSEALSNVVLHAHAPEDAAQQHLVLLAESDETSCRITISDDGDGLRARADSPGMGLGLALIANSCDELALDTGRNGGTIVRMAFLR
ncbi:MAG: ATP-binding protein [Solirubrobacterales bacterium]|nr:ATP-binding protein [Solirubrobacterales bacterium]